MADNVAITAGAGTTVSDTLAATAALGIDEVGYYLTTAKRRRRQRQQVASRHPSISARLIVSEDNDTLKASASVEIKGVLRLLEESDSIIIHGSQSWEQDDDEVTSAFERLLSLVA